MDVFFLVLAGAFSAMITFLLHNRYKQGIVRASAIVGLISGGFVYFFPDLLSPFLTDNLALVCFGASFIGMVSSQVLNNYWVLAIAGIVFTILYLSASSYIDGFGGSLGAAACIALLMVLGITKMFKQGAWKQVQQSFVQLFNK